MLQLHKDNLFTELLRQERAIAKQEEGIGTRRVVADKLDEIGARFELSSRKILQLLYTGDRGFKIFSTNGR
jgi:hypothetical protein